VQSALTPAYRRAVGTSWRESVLRAVAARLIKTYTRARRWDRQQMTDARVLLTPDTGQTYASRTPWREACFTRWPTIHGELAGDQPSRNPTPDRDADDAAAQAKPAKQFCRRERDPAGTDASEPNSSRRRTTTPRHGRRQLTNHQPLRRADSMASGVWSKEGTLRRYSLVLCRRYVRTRVGFRT